MRTVVRSIRLILPLHVCYAMKVNSAVPIGRAMTKGKRPLLALLLAAALLAVLVPLSTDLATAHAATGQSSFDNVQIAIQTSSSLPDSYSVSAYNTTGGLVASYQSQYPAAAFELPRGAYIFTATATQQRTVYYPVALANATATAQASSGVVVGPMIKCCTPPAECCPYAYTQPVVEYGYSSQQVSGPTSLTISTGPVNQTSTSTLSIHVTYPNGTLASGVYVSAGVLGDTYGWAYGPSSVSMSNSTDAQGTATLVTPTAPVLVSASASIPIVLPYNQSTVQVTIGGVKVNVTANWEPNQVSFAGQALILPPQTGAAIVLQYQPQSPEPIIYATGQTATGSAPGVSGSSTIAAQTTSEQQLPATASQSGTSNSGIFVISGIAAAISVAALSVVLFVAKSRPKPTIQ
jgi:hypothetical protein